MKNQITPEGILFDMDGVLVDSFDSWWKSLNKASKTLLKNSITQNEFKEKYWGNTLQENLQDLGIDAKNQKFCNIFYKEYLDEIILFKTTKKTLQKLNRYPKAIITNTPLECTQKILKLFQLSNYFDTVITSDQIKHGKPAPDMIYKACEQLNINSNHVVLVGDTQNDIDAGKSAGCTTIGIDTPADYTIQNISEILDIITN